MILDLWLNAVGIVSLQNNCMHEMVLMMNSENVQIFLGTQREMLGVIKLAASVIFRLACWAEIIYLTVQHVQ